MQTNVAQYRAAASPILVPRRRIRKCQMPEFDLAADGRFHPARGPLRISGASSASTRSTCAPRLGRFAPITTPTLGVEYVIQPSHRRRATLENIRHPTERNHGKHQLPQEPVERPHGSHRKPVVNHVAPDLDEQYH